MAGVFYHRAFGRQIGAAPHSRELGTNAVKYGALSNGEGYVSVTWAVVDAEHSARLSLHWRELNGPPVEPPSRKGFG
jgi:two-component sensor histidine kinase